MILHFEAQRFLGTRIFTCNRWICLQREIHNSSVITTEIRFMSYNNNPKAALMKFKQKINSHKFNPIALPNPMFSKKRTRSAIEEPKESPSKKAKVHNENNKAEEVHAKFDSGDFVPKKVDVTQFIQL